MAGLCWICVGAAALFNHEYAIEVRCVVFQLMYRTALAAVETEAGIKGLIKPAGKQAASLSRTLEGDCSSMISVSHRLIGFKGN